MNIATLLRRSAADHPADVALRLDDDEVDYAGYAERGARFAAYLRHTGVEPGRGSGSSCRTAPSTWSGCSVRGRPVRSACRSTGCSPTRRSATSCATRGCGCSCCPPRTGPGRRAAGRGVPGAADDRRVRRGPGGPRARGRRAAPARRRGRLHHVHLGLDGVPKGVRQTHRNFVAEAEGAIGATGSRRRPRAQLHAAVPRRRPAAGEPAGAAARRADHVHAALGTSCGGWSWPRSCGRPSVA
ncbi:hypothetical protein L7F22_025639 [Adiantum nelumboides]|nr:hypothetical protein [Adiantum nelumboides]